MFVSTMARQQEQQGKRGARSFSDGNSGGTDDKKLARKSREQLVLRGEIPPDDVTDATEPADAEDPFRNGSPLAVIRRFSEDIQQLCQSFLGDEATAPPSGRLGDLEVTQTDDRLIVRAWLTGWQKDDISVELRDSELCISGERQSEHGAAGFRRVVSLPRRISADAVSAAFEGGVLRIEIDISRRSSKGRRIEVREGHGRR